MTEAKNTEATTVPKASSKTSKTRNPKAQEQAVVQWQHGSLPTGIHDLATVQRIGDSYNTTKLDPVTLKPVVKQRKSLVIATPSSKTLGLSGDSGLQKQQEIGTAIKPIVMARVAAAGSSAAFIVRKYSETPGKHDKMSLTLERIQVESTVAKLAREYGMTEDEVKKRLGIKESTSIDV